MDNHADFECPHCELRPIPPFVEDEEIITDFLCPFCDTKIPLHFTLYDSDKETIWGGAFKTRGQARRWRISGELPATVYPIMVIDSLHIQQYNGNHS